MKNYRSKTGIATLVHSKDENEFVAKGPVGKSLFDNLWEINALDGLYVAFAAGTGVFVYYDLVYRIFMQNYSKVVSRNQSSTLESGRIEEFNVFPDRFAFQLYLSYVSESAEGSIPGLDLCNTLI